MHRLSNGLMGNTGSGNSSQTYLEQVASIDGAIYWTFDEVSGTIAKAYDSGGANSSYDGTYSGSYTLADVEFPKTGLSVATNPGSNAYVNLDNAAMDTLVGSWRSFTVGVWYRPTNGATQAPPFWSRHNAINADHELSFFKRNTDETIIVLTLGDTGIGTGGWVAGGYTQSAWNYGGFTFQDNTEAGGGKWYKRMNGTTSSGTHAITSSRTGFTDFRVSAQLNLTATLAGQVGILVVTPNYDEAAVDTIYDGGIA